ncbi:hypothetical protein [Variovorax sp. IB41]|uniref:hypothetical protein n=1 Tax=Variovorax sp. IB41 TaxID=2779370 RepID=UPI0018E76498|nr:hypothetical protein [Variovorax sp. IB41]MBJ2156632.1 hypothetical protein [Variovorax sp. IB41]
MSLYTFVLEFEGGTYVSQAEAVSVELAPSAWAEGIAPGTIRGMADASVRELREAIAEEVPVQLDGLQEVWCISTLVRGRMALVHFVSTARKF